MALYIGGTAVDATAAELNIMDGVTSTAAELNLLDGKSGVGPASIEMFYIASKASESETLMSYGAYLGGGILTQGSPDYPVLASGVAPIGFSSMGEIYMFWIKQDDTTNGINCSLKWNVAGDEEAHGAVGQSAQGLTEADSAENFASGIMYRAEVGQDITIEESIAEGDAFGLAAYNTAADDVVVVGFSIVWNF